MSLPYTEFRSLFFRLMNEAEHDDEECAGELELTIWQEFENLKFVARSSRSLLYNKEFEISGFVTNSVKKDVK